MRECDSEYTQRPYAPDTKPEVSKSKQFGAQIVGYHLPIFDSVTFLEAQIIPQNKYWRRGG